MPNKKYSIHWENDEPTSFEVDGIRYEELDQVPDEADRETLQAMMDDSIQKRFEEEFKDFDKKFQKDWEAHKKSSEVAKKVLVGIFAGVAALMLLIAGFSSFVAIRKLNSEASAPGRVVDMVDQGDYYPVVEFTSPDGRLHTAQMREGSQYPLYEIGESVTVRYKPEHPLDARISSPDSEMGMWIVPGITGVLGLVFLGAVFLVRMVVKSTEEEPSPV